MDVKLRSRTGQKPNKNVFIAVSHTFDYITTTFFDVMLSMETQYSYSLTRSNMLPLDRNRTELVSRALEDKSVTHILFIDTDIVPTDRKFLDIMMSYDLPIVGLLCTKKVPPYEPILVKKDAPEEEKFNGFWINYPKGLVEVDAIGTGCLLVKREVFEKMNKPYFLFRSFYEKNLYQSEDVYFMQSARNLGYKAYVDTNTTCVHYGPSGFGVADFERYKASLLAAVKQRHNNGVVENGK